MELKELLKQQGATIGAVATHLDGLTPEQRVAEAFALGRRGQRRLFELAADAPPIAFSHFVPSGVDARTEVRHRGRNTLPLPSKHKRFEKRFCRPPSEPSDDAQRLFGYNQAPSTGFVGPGYFVAIPTTGNDAWTPRGALVVDYFQVPDDPTAVPEQWPKVRPNRQGLQRFVYHGTRDFMRGVSDHVSIGAAYKGEKPLDHYFVLVREDN